MIRLNVLILTIVLILFSNCTNNESSQQIITDTEWVRSAQEGGSSAAYFSYSNSLDVPDTLLAVSSPAANMAQVHESYESDGMAGMREVEQLLVQPGETIQFEQGGLHVMLMQLKENLQEQDSTFIILEFAQQGKVEKHLPVKGY